MDKRQSALSSDPSLMLVSLITRLTFLVLPVPTQHQTTIFIPGWLSTTAREFGYKRIEVTTPTCAREFLSRNDKRKQQTGW